MLGDHCHFLGICTFVPMKCSVSLTILLAKTVFTLFSVMVADFFQPFSFDGFNCY